MVTVAILDSFRKLNPRRCSRTRSCSLWKWAPFSPRFSGRDDLAHGGGSGSASKLLFGCGSPFSSLISPKRWPKGAARRRPRHSARRRRKLRRDVCADGSTETVASSVLRAGDLVLVAAGEFVPGDGEVIEGVASVDESAITGESAPVIRESGGDRSAVTGGTRVLSDEIKVKITSNPGETFLDRMIQPCRRRVAPENAERDCSEHSVGRTDDHLSSWRSSRCSHMQFIRARRKLFLCSCRCSSA